MAQTLLTLAELITNAAHLIDTVCKSKGVSFPALDDPFDPTSEEIRGNPQIAQAVAYEAGFAVRSSCGHVVTWGDGRYPACLGREVGDKR